MIIQKGNGAFIESLGFNVSDRTMIYSFICIPLRLFINYILINKISFVGYLIFLFISVLMFKAYLDAKDNVWWSRLYHSLSWFLISILTYFNFIKLANIVSIFDILLPFLYAFK